MMKSLVHMYRTSRHELSEIQLREEAIVPVPVWSELERPAKEEAIAAYEALHAV